MRIFLYEFVTGGGTLGIEIPLGGSLLREGQAMVTALARDFGQLPDVEVHVLRDARLRDFQLTTAVVHDVHDVQQRCERYCYLASCACWTIVIAPEFGGSLLESSRCVQSCGGRLLSPDPTFIELTSDKRATHRALVEDDVPVPYQEELAPGERLPVDFPYPAVVKPADGAGSLHVRLARGSEDETNTLDGWQCLQSYCSGLPASVAILAGPTGFHTLPPCRQFLSDDGAFRYLGGDAPLGQQLAERASELARRVTRALPKTTGYFGIDLVLGEASDGSLDVVIEVNPRITTSYVGLRQLAHGNLARSMMAVASGEPCELPFGVHRVEFSIE